LGGKPAGQKSKKELAFFHSVIVNYNSNSPAEVISPVRFSERKTPRPKVKKV
jgi:hypothetical protein